MTDINRENPVTIIDNPLTDTYAAGCSYCNSEAADINDECQNPDHLGDRG